MLRNGQIPDRKQARVHEAGILIAARDLIPPDTNWSKILHEEIEEEENQRLKSLEERQQQEFERELEKLQEKQKLKNKKEKERMQAIDDEHERLSKLQLVRTTTPVDSDNKTSEIEWWQKKLERELGAARAQRQLEEKNVQECDIWKSELNISIQESLKRFDEEFDKVLWESEIQPYVIPKIRKSQFRKGNVEFNRAMDDAMHGVEATAKDMRKDMSIKFNQLRNQLSALTSSLPTNVLADRDMDTVPSVKEEDNTDINAGTRTTLNGEVVEETGKERQESVLDDSSLTEDDEDYYSCGEEDDFQMVST